MRLRFGDFVFDSDTREVIRGDEPLAISPKAFALLARLIESRPKAVSKEDLHSRLWPDTHVSDQSLGNLVVELRAVLGESARNPKIIRTVARFGYAFAARATADRSGGGELVASSVYYRLVWGRREISLEPGDNLIGRDPEAVVWIDDESVSRRHARISIDGEGATIQDLGSKNGTAVGDKRIRAPVRLSHRDVVRVGPASLTLRILKRTASTRSTIKEHRFR
jgi:DNA-binding winged helix-turn-helix (wHTH) protein